MMGISGVTNQEPLWFGDIVDGMNASLLRREKAA